MTVKEMFPKQRTLYSCEAVQRLLEKYYEIGGYVATIEGGCLGYGLTVATAPGYKTAVIREVYLNEWSCAHTIRMYNKMPAKYAALI